MGLAQAGPAVEIEGIIGVPRGFRRRQGGGMGEAVAAAHHEGIEFVLGVQMGVLIGGAALLNLLRVLLHDELHVIVMVEQLRYGHAEEASVSGGDVVEHMGLVGGDDDVHHIVGHVQESQRLHPCLIGNIGEFIFPFDLFLNGSPAAFDIIHFLNILSERIPFGILILPL